MLYEIDTSTGTKITWGTKGTDRILQNIINLLNTYRYEIAYARTIGIDPDWIHAPAGKAAGIITNGVIDLLSKREPRAKIKKVQYLGISQSGDIQLKVVVEI